MVNWRNVFRKKFVRNGEKIKGTTGVKVGLIKPISALKRSRFSLRDLAFKRHDV